MPALILLINGGNDRIKSSCTNLEVIRCLTKDTDCAYSRSNANDCELCTDGGDELVLADAGWDSIQIHNGIASFIIENGYGYETRVLSGSTAMTFTSLREGSIDIYMETWQGNLKDSYDEGIESGDILELSVNYDDSRQGYYVPTFVIEGDPSGGLSRWPRICAG